MQEFDDIIVSNSKLSPNDEVEIKQGLLMNFKGIVLEVIGNSAKVKIEGMGITLTAIFDKKNLEKVSTM